MIDDKDSEGTAQKVKRQTKSCAGYSVKYLKNIKKIRKGVSLSKLVI